MDPRLNILTELKEISPLLAGISPVTPYSVPDAYFDGFANQVMQRIRVRDEAGTELANLSPLLSNISKKSPYVVPENYFSELSEQALSGAKAIAFVNEELENLSPLMMQLKRANVFEAPVGYFDSLATEILEKAKHQQPAKLFTLRPFRKMARYAVAAAFIGLMAIGDWLIQKPAVSTMPVARIENGIRNATDEEMLNFVQDDTGALSEQPVLSSDEEMDSLDMKAMLADVSDKELEQFISEPTEQTN